MKHLVLIAVLFAAISARAQEIPATVNWDQAQKPLLVNTCAVKDPQGAAWYDTADAGRLPALMLIKLGLPLKFAADENMTPYFEAHPDSLISTYSYPATRAMGGDYTTTDLWNATPAFKQTFQTPEAMVAALRFAALQTCE
jgi:hypothetical protein